MFRLRCLLFRHSSALVQPVELICSTCHLVVELLESDPEITQVVYADSGNPRKIGGSATSLSHL